MGSTVGSQATRVGLAAALVALALGAALVLRDGGSDGERALVRSDSNPLVTTDGDPDPSTSAPTTAPPVPTTAGPVPMALPPGPAPAISRVATTDRVIFLGIDDGLTRDPAVLDYLDAQDIPFTSFLVTNALQADPAFWARARAIGGTIQAHTITHPNLTRVGVDQIRRELCGSADTIQQATGVRPTLFRPPYGSYNDTVRAVASECGFLALVMWKGATNDGRVELQEQVLAPGDVLLLHWRPDLLLNLQSVKALADAQGFRIARVEDYLQPRP